MPAPLLVKGILIMLRRVILLGGTLLVGVIVLGSVALADDIRGTFGKDDLPGTNQMDRIYGLGAADIIEVGRQRRLLWRQWFRRCKLRKR